MDPITAAYLFNLGFSTVAAWMNKRQQDRASGAALDQSQIAQQIEQQYYEEERRRQDEDRQRQQQQDDQDRAESNRRYEQKAQDFAPYLRMGRSALSRLAFGLGVPDDPTDNSGGPITGPTGAQLQPGPRVNLNWGGGTPADAAQAPQSPQGALPSPGMPQGGSLNMMGMGGQSGSPQGPPNGLTRIQTPTGQLVLVPFSQLQEALANGGRRV